MNVRSPQPRTEIDQYEAPTIELVGLAEEIVQGVPGGVDDMGWSYAEPGFEFEVDPE